MQQKHYWILGVIIVIIIGVILFMTNPLTQDKKSDGSESLDFFLSDYCTAGNNCDLECQSDSDCVLMTCGGFNFAAHKDVIGYLNNEKIINNWCSGSSQIVKSNEQNVICSSSLDVYPETYKKCILAP